MHFSRYFWFYFIDIITDFKYFREQLVFVGSRHVIGNYLILKLVFGKLVVSLNLLKIMS